MKYEVWIQVSGWYRLEVEADSYDEAKDAGKALAKDHVKNLINLQFDVTDCGAIRGE
jgi:hypothetical protein